jgi:hypothetical protein
MADVISSTFSNLGSQVASGANPAAGFGVGWIIGIAIFIGFAVMCVVGAFVWYYFYDKKQWNIKTRVHYENPAIDGITMGDGVPTKRLRFKDGRVVYLYKTAIQGYTISPELLTWTRPREHDVIVTQDKKLFCLVGISGIDAQRKLLKVDISYPDIEMDRQDLQQHIDSKKVGDPNEKFKIIAKAAAIIFICITIIVVMVLAGKAYVDGKGADASRDASNVKVAEYNAETAKNMATFMAIMAKVMPESFKQIDGQALIEQGRA